MFNECKSVMKPFAHPTVNIIQAKLYRIDIEAVCPALQFWTR